MNKDKNDILLLKKNCSFLLFLKLLLIVFLVLCFLVFFDYEIDIVDCCVFWFCFG